MYRSARSSLRSHGLDWVLDALQAMLPDVVERLDTARADGVAFTGFLKSMRAVPLNAVVRPDVM